MRPRYAMFGGRLRQSLIEVSATCCTTVSQVSFMCVGELLSRSVGEPFDIGIGPGFVIAAILMASSLLS